ncbi:MAG: nucleotidyl transferase AbiEii/AbiGii toxin family protein [Terriglobales bacterium]
MDDVQQAWHLEVMSAGLFETADRITAFDVLRDFYLAGGTALALQLGHRRSIDLDFFTSQPFSEDVLIGTLQAMSEFSVVSRASQTLHLHISGAKISLFGYPYPLLFPLRNFRALAVADERDIGCMKISALAGRGTRRDFVDLYFIAQRHGFEPVLDMFKRKFATANYSMVHIRKSLAYFADAESEPMPDMLVPASWPAIRQFFENAVRKLQDR